VVGKVTSTKVTPLGSTPFSISHVLKSRGERAIACARPFADGNPGLLDRDAPSWQRLRWFCSPPGHTEAPATGDEVEPTVNGRQKTGRSRARPSESSPMSIAGGCCVDADHSGRARGQPWRKLPWSRATICGGESLVAVASDLSLNGWQRMRRDTRGHSRQRKSGVYDGQIVSSPSARAHTPLTYR